MKPVPSRVSVVFGWAVVAAIFALAGSAPPARADIAPRDCTSPGSPCSVPGQVGVCQTTTCSRGGACYPCNMCVPQACNAPGQPCNYCPLGRTCTGGGRDASLEGGGGFVAGFCSAQVCFSTSDAGSVTYLCTSCIDACSAGHCPSAEAGADDGSISDAPGVPDESSVSDASLGGSAGFICSDSGGTGAGGSTGSGGAAGSDGAAFEDVIAISDGAPGSGGAAGSGGVPDSGGLAGSAGVPGSGGIPGSGGVADSGGVGGNPTSGGSAGSTGSDNGGCSCRLVGGARHASAPLLWGCATLGGFLFARRRRQKVRDHERRIARSSQ